MDFYFRSGLAVLNLVLSFGKRRGCSAVEDSRKLLDLVESRYQINQLTLSQPRAYIIIRSELCDVISPEIVFLRSKIREGGGGGWWESPLGDSSNWRARADFLVGLIRPFPHFWSTLR